MKSNKFPEFHGCGLKNVPAMHIRVIQNFKHEKFIWDPADSNSLRKRNAEKCQNYQNRTTFKGAYFASKFYYITHLCDMSENSKIGFFKVFHFKLSFCFHN